MKFAPIIVLCALGMSLAACDTIQTSPSYSGAKDSTSFKGDLNNLGGPARNAPDMRAPAGP